MPVVPIPEMEPDLEFDRREASVEAEEPPRKRRKPDHSDALYLMELARLWQRGAQRAYAQSLRPQSWPILGRRREGSKLMPEHAFHDESFGRIPGVRSYRA